MIRSIERAERIVERFATLTADERRELGRAAPDEDGSLWDPGQSAWWQARAVAWEHALEHNLMTAWRELGMRIESAAGINGCPQPGSVDVEATDAIDVAQFAALAELLGRHLAPAQRRILLAPWQLVVDR